MLSTVTHEPSKLGQTDLVLVCGESLSVGLLLVAVMIDATLIKTHTHRQTASDWLYY